MGTDDERKYGIGDIIQYTLDGQEVEIVIQSVHETDSGYYYGGGLLNKDRTGVKIGGTVEEKQILSDLPIGVIKMNDLIEMYGERWKDLLSESVQKNPPKFVNKK